MEEIKKAFEKQYTLPFGAVFKKDHYIIKETNGNEHYPFFNNSFRQFAAGWKAHENQEK